MRDFLQCTTDLSPAPSGMLLAAEAQQRRKAPNVPHAPHLLLAGAGQPRGLCQAGEESTWDQAGSPPNTVDAVLLHPSQPQHLLLMPNPGRTSIISHLYSCDSLLPRPSDLPSAQSHLPSAQILFPSPMTSPLPIPAPPVTALKVVCKCA